MTNITKDGWITHDGGACPIAPGRLAMVNGDITVALPGSSINWEAVKKYRTFSRVNPPEPGPSSFVAAVAGQIMAAGTWGSSASVEDDATFAVRAATALERALKDDAK